jgi:hypothetical protein
MGACVGARFILAILAVLLLGACSTSFEIASGVLGQGRFAPVGSVGPAGTDHGTDHGSGGTVGSTGSTYANAIGGLIAQNCASCHNRTNGIAPFPLENYNDVFSHAAEIKAAVKNRTMPPPGVDNSGTCSSFSNSDWLSEEDINKITSWVDGGSARGDVAYIPPVPASRSLSNVSTTLRMTSPYTPAPGAGKIDDYRCFIIDPQNSQDTLITGLEIRPDKSQEVHHVIVFEPASDSAQASAVQKDGEGGKPGYSCFGSPGVSARVVGLWAPGGKPQEPVDPISGKALGIRLQAGRKLIMQVHYNTQNGVFTDQSSIALRFDASAIPVRWVLMGDFTLNLPPGNASVTATSTLSNAEVLTATNVYEGNIALASSKAMSIYMVAPHMHRLGTSIKVENVSSASKSSCLASVPTYDFNWQQGFSFKQAQSFSTSDSLKITCQFSTATKTTATTFGENTTDEMCLAFLLVNE